MLGRKRQIGNTLSLIDRNNISSLRERIKVLVVDDEDDSIVQVLNERRYNVYYKKDMTYAIEAEPFDILFLDIRGVAKRLRSSMEGFQLAKEVKLKYPLKQVYCFSSAIPSLISQELSEKRIDGFMPKDTEIDKWCEKLDKIIYDYIDLNKQWENIQKQLRDNQIEEKEIQSIKKVFFKSFDNTNFDELYQIIMEIVKNTTAMLGLINGILGLMKILIV